VNFGTPVPLLIGLVLVISAIALFFLDKLKPGYGRDADKVYSGLLLLSGVFLLGHLTMELIPSFQQMLMAGMLIALLIDNIRNRDPLQAGSRPDEGRPPVRGESRDGRRVYRAELDDYDQRGDRWDSPRISGAGDRYADDYDDGYRRQPSGNAPMGRLNPSSDRIRRRRPRTADNRYGTDAVWDENPNPRRPSSWDEGAWGREPERDRYSQSASKDDAQAPRSQNGSGYANYQPINGHSDSDRDRTDY
jgi:hypothetical protein